jgi:cell division transport system permease protein
MRAGWSCMKDDFMPTTEQLDAVAETMQAPWDELVAAPAPGNAPRIATPIVPRDTIAGRSLVAVVAIMTFFAALTVGGVMLMVNAAGDWQSAVGREVTIQVRPADGRDIEADVSKAIEIARATPGIADVQAYSKEQSEQLIEPWLGAGLKLDELPIPRMIVVKLLSGAQPNFGALRKSLAAQVPSASLDDHRGWVDRMRAMARTVVAVGFAILVLVLVVTMLSVTFATRGAMATNRPIVEVLHYVGATDDFVAGQFLRHFLLLGFKGGVLGGGIAMVLFGCLEAANAWLSGTPGGDETAALFGRLSIGVSGYLAIAALIVVMALVTALVSRQTVNRTLEAID